MMNRLKVSQYGYARIPALPLDYFKDLQKSENPSLYAVCFAIRGASSELYTPSIFLRAIENASPSLYKAILKASCPEETPAKVRAACLKYLIRISTRCTPFGHFAGVGIFTVGAEHSLKLLPGSSLQQIFHSDKEKLLRDSFWIGTGNHHQSEPSLSLNPRIFFLFKEIFLCDVPLNSHHRNVSVMQSKVFRTIYETLKNSTPEQLSSLITKLSVHTGKEAHEIELSLSELIANLLLISNIPAKILTDNKVECTNFVSSSDIAPKHISSSEIPSLSNPLCNSVFFPQGNVSSQLVSKIAKLAELKFQLSKSPTLAICETLRAEFISRYGVGRSIKLIELVSGARSFKIPRSSNAYMRSLAKEQSIRNQVILSLLQESCFDDLAPIRLKSSDITSLTSWRSKKHKYRFRPSYEVGCSVLSESCEAINSKEYSLAIDRNFSNEAGRMIGRFINSIGAPAIRFLRHIREIEENSLGDCLDAEVFYIPANFRGANVASRPITRKNTIFVDMLPPKENIDLWGNPINVIPLDEIYVYASSDRLQLHCGITGREIKCFETHMLSLSNAPELVKLLMYISWDGYESLCDFDWGVASNSTALPRVEFGNDIISRAKWRFTVDNAPPKLREEFAAWRRRWHLPQIVSIVAGDNRLPIDLENTGMQELLHKEASVAFRNGRPLHLEEFLETHEQSWCLGESGIHACELIIPIFPVPQKNVLDDSIAIRIPNESIPTREVQWLYYRVPIEDWIEESAIVNFSKVVKELKDAQLIDAWHFVRYSDPEEHIRFRMRLLQQENLQRVMELVKTSFFQELGNTCSYSVEQYECEFERYGATEESMTLVEEIFDADSSFVASLIKDCDNMDEENRIISATLCIDGLLNSFGITRRQGIDILKMRSGNSKKTVKIFRRSRTMLEKAIKRSPHILSEHFGQNVYRALIIRDLRITELCEKLINLEMSMSRSCVEILTSVVHMHCNRLLGRNIQAEKSAYHLLQMIYLQLEAKQTKTVITE